MIEYGNPVWRGFNANSGGGSRVLFGVFLCQRRDWSRTCPEKACRAVHTAGLMLQECVEGLQGRRAFHAR